MKITDLSKQFNNKFIFNNLSHEFIDKKINFIIGDSGKGKTTLFNMISKIDNDYTGKIENDNMKISLAFQDYRLLENFSAIKNLQIVNHKSYEYYKKELSQVLIFDDDLNKKVKEFSGGMKARLSIVRAMNFNAELILMDEPFKALDEISKEKTFEYVFNKKNDSTLIIITHSKSEIESLNKLNEDIYNNKYILDLNNF